MRFIVYEFIAILLFALAFILRNYFDSYIPDTDLIQGIISLAFAGLLATIFVGIPSLAFLTIKDKRFPNLFSSKKDNNDKIAYFLSLAILFMGSFFIPRFEIESNIWLEIITIITIPLIVVKALHNKISMNEQVIALVASIFAAVFFTVLILGLMLLASVII